MKKKPLVSIIIPVYNVEPYISKCLDTVISQSYSMLEIIIVIDGSFDNSLSIAQNYEKMDSRITILCQENQGSGPARNKGLDHSSGELVVFVDPDDWLEPMLVEHLVTRQLEKNYDLVVSGVMQYMYNEKGRFRYVEKRPVIAECKTKKEARKNYFEFFENGLISGPQHKIYKMSIIRENKVRFPEFRRSQDIVFNYRYYEYVDSVLITDYLDFNYRVLLEKRYKKMPYDYYKILGCIYKEIKEMHNQWGVVLSKERIANKFVYNAMFCIESNVLANRELNDILSDAIITEIFKNTTINRMDVFLVRFAMKKESKLLVFAILKLRYVIRKNFRHGI